jgi:hypothetical protein
VEDGDQQPHSVSLQPSQRSEKCVAIGGPDERLECRAATRKTGQAGKPREVICGGVGISQKTEDKPHWLVVESRVLEAIGVGGRSHHQTPEARDLGVWHSDPATNAGRKNCFSLEESRDHLLARFNEAGLFEKPAESPEELRPPADIGRDQHHRGIQLL